MSEELEEQAALYVLELLEGAEAASFERHLETDAELRAFVDQLDEATASVAHGAPRRPLPPELRERVLNQMKSGKETPFPRRMNWLPWAIAAGLALACSYLVADRSGLQKQITRLEKRDYLDQFQIASLTSKLKNAPNANAVIFWDEDKQRGILRVTALPRNAKDSDYQLWVVDPDRKNPIGAGTFHVSNEGVLSVPFQPISPVHEAHGFAISLERKGGVTKAEGPIVLLGK